ncbi:MAG: hypothetical protein HND57_07370 [Planctomycetes bacterium]|nr:hypothetical protein [Planctomycetota bacterium]
MTPPPTNTTTVFGIEVLTFAGYAISAALLWGYVALQWLWLMRSRARKAARNVAAS